MNIIKGIFGFGGTQAEKLVDSTKVKGDFYRINNGKRQIEIDSALISFQKIKDHPEYKFIVNIKSQDKEKPRQHTIPIHQNMDLKLFPNTKYSVPKICYQWILINQKDSPLKYVGIMVDPKYQTELSDTFGYAIRETVDKDSKQNHLNYVSKVTQKPKHQSDNQISKLLSQSNVSNVSNVSSTSKVSSISKAQRMEQLNDTLIRQATLEETQLAFTGRLYHIIKQKVTQINPSIVFCIKQKSPFNYSLYVYTSKGFKLQEKPITNNLSFSINLQNSYIKWLDLSSGQSKIVQVIFDKYDVARDVQFCITRCKYQTYSKKKMQDMFQPQDEEYIKHNLQEQKNPFNNPKIVQVYEDEQKLISPLTESRKTIKNSKQVVEKYKQKKTMAQGKTSGFTIVSLQNMLDVLIIDKDKNLIKTQTIQLKDKKGNEIIPEKILIHDSDSKLLIQRQDNVLSYFDMNEQKLIEQYKIGDEPINDIVAEKKLAQLDKTNHFIAVSNNGIYKIDPRDHKAGLTEKHIYKGDKYQFDKIVTTSDGNYAIGSLDGTIRLYNNKNINNKTKACNKFPYLDKVLHLDTTKDGKWILATFPHELILLPTFLEDDVNLYEQTVPIADRQRPKRLKVKLQHLQFCKSENKQMIPARFDESVDRSEALIISGFGDYVVIWSFDKVLKGYYDYKFCKAEDIVNNVEFKFNDPSSFFTNTHSSISMQNTLNK